jgi:hypothetical protein
MDLHYFGESQIITNFVVIDYYLRVVAQAVRAF